MGDSILNIVCGDCGSPDTQWGSLNKGIYLCNDCSFIHRSLGPQCSRVKSLTHSPWHENLKKMMMTLAAGPANNVWEHLLLNPSKSEPSVKKPSSSDSLEGVKKRFITQKHLQFHFVLRQKADTFKERNEELHCTVRTADVGTALRLIASGADPNFFHPERGTRPLHVACRCGQALQVELLFVHGAEIDAPDYLGQTPGDHAKAAGFKELAMRIEELRYHLTDQLSRFVCGEVPDHKTAKHIIIPPAPANSHSQDERIKALPSHMLEQLASDLYDEVERRDVEKILMNSNVDVSKYSIAFLPVNQNFPSVRNQTRQKFARLTDNELSALITAVLRESKQRHKGSALESDKDIFLDNEDDNIRSSTCEIPQLNGSAALHEDDEFPLYDSVASDDDIVMSEVQTIQTHMPPANNFNPAISCAFRNANDNPYLTKLAEDRIAELESNNLALKYELKVVKQMLSDYVQDNLERRRFSELDRLNSNSLLEADGRSGGVVLRQHLPSSELSTHLRKFRSVSMYAEKPEEEMGSRGKEDIGTTVQATTRDIVELIKVLIEFARSGDYQGVQLTANKVYDVAQGMASSLLLYSSTDSDKNIRVSLHNMVVKVLRMKTEVPLLSNSQLLKAAALADPSLSNIDHSDLYVQKIKQLCFDVGAAMKILVSSTVPSA